MENPVTIVTQSDLKQAIQKLEERRTEETALLKQQFEVAYESVKPINLVRSTMKEIVSSDALKSDVFNSSIGLAAGVVSRALFIGFSGNPLRKLAGTVLMFGVTNLVTKNTSPVRRLGRKLLTLIRHKMADADARELPGSQL